MQSSIFPDPLPVIQCHVVKRVGAVAAADGLLLVVARNDVLVALVGVVKALGEEFARFRHSFDNKSIEIHGFK